MGLKRKAHFFFRFTIPVKWRNIKIIDPLIQRFCDYPDGGSLLHANKQHATQPDDGEPDIIPINPFGHW
jgi:hypothetical protein